jgi:hypothetical protein
MANPFKGSPVELHGMVYDMVPVTPNDGTDNVGTGNIAVGLYVTNAGDVSFCIWYSRTGGVNVKFGRIITKACYKSRGRLYPKETVFQW